MATLSFWGVNRCCPVGSHYQFICMGLVQHGLRTVLSLMHPGELDSLSYVLGSDSDSVIVSEAGKFHLNEQLLVVNQ